MVCRFVGSNYRDKLELCLIMELNDSFNFSAFDAWLIIKQHRDNAKNVSEVTEVILIIIYCTLIFLGVLSNVVVSFVVARRPQMHTARNLYIVNLTVSDLTLCMICMPFTLVHIINRHWTLGVALCKLVPFVQGTNIMVSVGTITVIALDRYFTIVRGQDGPTTRRRVIISIIAVWALSMLTTMPVLFFQVPEHYTYRYQVSDKDTGVYKEHSEFRTGGIVHGSLSIVKSDSRFDIRYKGLPKKGWESFVERVTPAWMLMGQVALGESLQSQAASKPLAPNHAAPEPPVSSQDAPKRFLSNAAPSDSLLAKGAFSHPFTGQPAPGESHTGQAVCEGLPVSKFPSSYSLMGHAACRESLQGLADSRDSLSSEAVPRRSLQSQAAPGSSLLGKAIPERQGQKQVAPGHLLPGKAPLGQSLLVKAVHEGQGQKQAAQGDSLQVKDAPRHTPQSQASVPHHKPLHSYQNLKELEKRHGLFYHHNHYHVNDKSSKGK